MDKLPNLSRRGVIAGGVAMAAAASSSRSFAQTAGENPDWEVVDLRPGIWRTRNARHFGLAVEGENGLAMFDPVGSADFAAWAQARLAERSDKAISHIIYSHNHSDHVAGGEGFDAPNATVLAHELARESMVRMGTKTRLPTLTFKEAFTVDLGGRNIALRYHGPNDGRGSISLRVPDQQVLSVVDWLVIDRMPYRDLARYNVDGTIRSLAELEHMDWEVAAPGHGVTGGKDKARILVRYLETVRDGVIEGITTKESVDAITARLRPQLAAVPEYAALGQFDAWVDLNIRGVHDQIARVEGFMDG